MSKLEIGFDCIFMAVMIGCFDWFHPVAGLFGLGVGMVLCDIYERCR